MESAYQNIIYKMLVILFWPLYANLYGHVFHLNALSEVAYIFEGRMKL